MVCDALYRSAEIECKCFSAISRSREIGFRGLQAGRLWPAKTPLSAAVYAAVMMDIPKHAAMASLLSFFAGREVAGAPRRDCALMKLPPRLLFAAGSVCAVVPERCKQAAHAIVRNVQDRAMAARALRYMSF
jgi:hypothetical protein